jgi:hypothetical protein
MKHVMDRPDLPIMLSLLILADNKAEQSLIVALPFADFKVLEVVA